MSEMQSAEEFATKLYMNKGPDIDVDKELVPQYVALTRARDKAIVELTLDIVYKKYGLVVESDDVLRELGGEQ